MSVIAIYLQEIIWKRNWEIMHQYMINFIHSKLTFKNKTTFFPSKGATENIRQPYLLWRSVRICIISYGDVTPTTPLRFQFSMLCVISTYFPFSDTSIVLVYLCVLFSGTHFLWVCRPGTFRESLSRLVADQGLGAGWCPWVTAGAVVEGAASSGLQTLSPGQG